MGKQQQALNDIAQYAVILYFLDLFVGCQNVICLISFKIRLDPFALISLGFIRPAGSSLTSPLYGATRIFRPRPTERAENADGLRTTLPIPSVHESFDLLSKAFTRRWGLLCFRAL